MTQETTATRANMEHAKKALKEPKTEKNGAYPNPSGIIPTEFKCLVLPELSDLEKRMQSSGLVAPDTTKEKEMHAQNKGVLVALSPVAFTYENFPADARLPKPGDKVYYAKYAGALVTGADGQQYRIINDRDISAVIEF